MTPPSVSPADAQFVVSALAVLGIQKAKSHKGVGKLIPWITHETDRLNRLIAVAISFATSFGINATFHAGVLTVAGLTWSTAVAAIVFFGRSLLGQEAIYRFVKMASHLSELTNSLAALANAPAGALPPSDSRKSWQDVAAEAGKTPIP